jgi:ASC-1-like (ASCH) protein
MQEVNVNKIWFDFIKSGLKTVEGRLNKGKFSNMKVGDIIKFVSGNDSVQVKIINITHYKSFESYLIMEGLKRTLPGIKNIKDGLNVYYSYFTKEQEDEFNILAIDIKKI